MHGVLTERRNYGSTKLGVLLIALGAIAMLVPVFSALVLIRVITWLVIFTGIEQAIYAYQTRGEGGLFFKVLLAVLYAVAGGLLLGRPVSGAVAVTAVIGVLLIADGITEIALGAQLRHTYDARIGWLFAGGILSVVLGAFIVYRLPRSAVAVGVLLGVRLIFKGIEHIVRSSAGAKIEHIGERRAA
jgi:uncharacterized membrane protein HdeD (DUF308 family)